MFQCAQKQEKLQNFTHTHTHSFLFFCLFLAVLRQSDVFFQSALSSLVSTSASYTTNSSTQTTSFPIALFTQMPFLEISCLYTLEIMASISTAGHIYSIHIYIYGKVAAVPDSCSLQIIYQLFVLSPTLRQQLGTFFLFLLSLNISSHFDVRGADWPARSLTSKPIQALRDLEDSDPRSLSEG